MKQLLNNKNKIMYGIAFLIIIIGVIVIFTKGFTKSLEYGNSQKIEIYIGKEFNTNDIKSMTDEVFEGKQVSIKKVELFKDMVSISAKEISQEQKDAMIEKIKEKYSLQDVATEIVTVSGIKLSDIVKRYAFPTAISFAIILVYAIVVLFKLNILKVIGKLILNTCIAETVYFSILAITRLPICRITMPIALIIYVITIFIMMCKFQKELTDKKQEEEEK